MPVRKTLQNPYVINCVLSVVVLLFSFGIAWGTSSQISNNNSQNISRIEQDQTKIKDTVIKSILKLEIAVARLEEQIKNLDKLITHMAIDIKELKEKKLEEK